MGILHVEIGLYIETMPWAIWKNLFSYTCHIDLKESSTYSQIAKIIVSTVIRYRSKTEVSGRFLFDVDTRIFAISVTSYLCQTAKHNHNMLQSHRHHLERSLGRDDGKIRTVWMATNLRSRTKATNLENTLTLMSGMNNQLTPKTIVHAEMSAH